MEEKNWKVYVHINKINEKRYYGITRQEKVEYRWNNGNGYSHNEHFTNAIQKYGWSNFEHIIIAKGLSEEEAKWLEIELIREHDTTNQDKGYNQTLGGDGIVGYHHTEETKKKQSEAHKGKPRSEETKKKISERMSGEGNHMFGKTHTEETRKKMSEANKGKNNGSAKSVICLTTKKIFYTAKEGAEYYNIDNSDISKCCKGKRKSVGKYKGQKLVWRYLVWEHSKTYRIVRNKEVV